MIPQAVIEEIKGKANIAHIISSYVQIKKRGKNYLGLCPFHSEKTPSFTVSEEKGLYHCFGCGKGGNLFTFVMEMEKVDFAEAVSIIGEKVGIHVERGQGGGTKANANDNFYALMELACKFYASNLDQANEYLKKRKISDPKVFRLGFAPPLWDALLNYLVGRGARAEDLEKLGLVLARSGGDGFYDRFRNRLMFPITDARNRVIGFSGRSMGDDEPKYLNSPDTVIFNKGDNLYNLGLAREAIKDQKFALLVEGNIDAVASYEAGLKNVVAPLGTAFTPAQAKLLRRFTDLAVLAFDNDAAGAAAAERAQEILKDAGMRVRIADFKNAKDPDELIKKEGKEAFVTCIQKSLPATEYRLRRVINRFNLNEAEARARAAHEALLVISKEKDVIVQGEYLKLAAELLKIPAETLAAELRGTQSFRGGRSPLRRVTQKPNSKLVEAEKVIIRLMLEWDEALPRIKDELTLDNFVQYRSVAGKLWEHTAAEVLNGLANEEEAKLLREIMLSEEPLEQKEMILTDCINSLKAQTIKEQMEALKGELLAAEKAGKIEALNRMHKEYLGLNEILRSLSR